MFKDLFVNIATRVKLLFSLPTEDFKVIVMFLLCFFSFLFVHKTSQRWLNRCSSKSQNRKTLEHPTLWNDRLILLDVYTLFCFVRRYFRSSPGVHAIILFRYSIYFTKNESDSRNPYMCQKPFTSVEISQLFQVTIFKQILFSRDHKNCKRLRHETLME